MESLFVGKIGDLIRSITLLLGLYSPLFLFRALVTGLIISGSALALISRRKKGLEVVMSSAFRLLVLDFQKFHSRESLIRVNFGMVLFILRS